MPKSSASRPAATPRKPRTLRSVPKPASTRPVSMALPSPLPMTPSPATHDQIARLAFEFYEAREGAPGTELADWLRAESELSSVH